MRVSATARSKRAGSSVNPGARPARFAAEGEHREQHELHDHHPRRDPVGEAPGGGGPVLFERARIGGHERGAERPLGEDRTEMIGQPEGNQESVGDRTGAEDRRHHDVAENR
jgi:hypothetical protein